MYNRLYSSNFALWPQQLPSEDCVDCPHCGTVLEVDDNRWSDDRSDYESGVIECPACKQDFVLTVCYIMHVSANKKE